MGSAYLGLITLIGFLSIASIAISYPIFATPEAESEQKANDNSPKAEEDENGNNNGDGKTGAKEVPLTDQEEEEDEVQNQIGSQIEGQESPDSLSPPISAQEPVSTAAPESNVSLSEYPYLHILPPTALTETQTEQNNNNNTQTESTAEERGGGDPLKGLNIQTGGKPLPPCPPTQERGVTIKDPFGSSPCIVKK